MEKFIEEKQTLPPKEAFSDVQQDLDLVTRISQRDILVVNISDMHIECVVVATCADGNCALSTIRNFFNLREQEEFTNEFTRENFIQLVRDYQSIEKYKKYIDAIIKKYDNIDEWAKAFSDSGFWFAEEHFKFLSFHYKIEFKFYYIPPEKNANYFIFEQSICETTEVSETIDVAHIGPESEKVLNHFETLIIKPTPKQKALAAKLSNEVIKKGKERSDELLSSTLALMPQQTSRQESYRFTPQTYGTGYQSPFRNPKLSGTSDPAYLMPPAYNPVQHFYTLLNARILVLKNPNNPAENLIKSIDTISNARFKILTIILLNESIIRSMLTHTKESIKELKVQLEEILPVCSLAEEEYFFALGTKDTGTKKYESIKNKIIETNKKLQQIIIIFERSKTSYDKEIKNVAQTILDSLLSIKKEYGAYIIQLENLKDDKLENYLRTLFCVTSIYVQSMEVGRNFFLIPIDAAHKFSSTTFDSNTEAKKTNLDGSGKVACLKTDENSTIFAKITVGILPQPVMSDVYTSCNPTVCNSKEKISLDKSNATITGAPTTMVVIPSLRRFNVTTSKKNEKYQKLLEEDNTTDILTKCPELMAELGKDLQITFEKNKVVQFSYGISGISLSDYYTIYYVKWWENFHI